MNLNKIKANVKIICEIYGYSYCIPEIIISEEVIFRRDDVSFKAFGKYSPQTNTITLNKSFCDSNTDKIVVDLLKHEISHLKYPNHGCDFEKECKRTGILRHIRFDHSLLKTSRGISLYNCSSCNKIDSCNEISYGCSVNLKPYLKLQ